MLEIGSYCGKSSSTSAPPPRERDTVLFALDHHRGSEENQPGWEWHEPDLVDPDGRAASTRCRSFRRTVHDAGLEASVVALVGDSPTVGRHWPTPLSLLFIDGGHGTEPAHRDYEMWTPWVEPGGLLAIHDVFPDPADGGRPPYEIYCRALESGLFDERARPSARSGVAAAATRAAARGRAVTRSVDAGTRSVEGGVDDRRPAARSAPAARRGRRTAPRPGWSPASASAASTIDAAV